MIMRVRMVHQISGTRNGAEWPRPGGEVDLPDIDAATLIRQQMAVAVEDTPKVETAAAPEKAETRKETPKVPARRPPGRPRKTPGK